MSRIGKMASVFAGAALFAMAGGLMAGEKLDLNGTFEGDGQPRSWSPNMPGYWDDEGSMTLVKVDGADKTAVKIESKTRKMHIFTKQYPIGKGDKLRVKGMVRGKGAGSLGAYFYPGAGWTSKEFKATAEWTEFEAELTFQDTVEKICVVLGITPESSIEFMNVTAEIEKP